MQFLQSELFLTSVDFFRLCVTSTPVVLCSIIRRLALDCLTLHEVFFLRRRSHR